MHTGDVAMCQRISRHSSGHATDCCDKACCGDGFGRSTRLFVNSDAPIAALRVRFVPIALKKSARGEPLPSRYRTCGKEPTRASVAYVNSMTQRRGRLGDFQASSATPRCIASFGSWLAQ